MNQLLFIVIDRGGGVLFIIVLAFFVVSLLSLPLMPLFHYAQNESLKLTGGRVYGFLGVAMIISGFVLIPAVLFVVIAAGVVRYKGTGMPQSATAFIVGCAIWLLTPVVFILLGQFQVRFGRRLAPILWDKKLRIAERRRKADLRRSRSEPT